MSMIRKKTLKFDFFLSLGVFISFVIGLSFFLYFRSSENDLISVEDIPKPKQVEQVGLLSPVTKSYGELPKAVIREPPMSKPLQVARIPTPMYRPLEQVAKNPKMLKEELAVLVDPVSKKIDSVKVKDKKKKVYKRSKRVRRYAKKDALSQAKRKAIVRVRKNSILNIKGVPKRKPDIVSVPARLDEYYKRCRKNGRLIWSDKTTCYH